MERNAIFVGEEMRAKAAASTLREELAAREQQEQHVMMNVIELEQKLEESRVVQEATQHALLAKAELDGMRRDEAEQARQSATSYTDSLAATLTSITRPFRRPQHIVSDAVATEYCARCGGYFQNLESHAAECTAPLAQVEEGHHDQGTSSNARAA